MEKKHKHVRDMMYDEFHSYYIYLRKSVAKACIDKALSCPFCGNSKLSIEFRDTMRDGGKVRCSCGASGSYGWAPISTDEAVGTRKWDGKKYTYTVKNAEESLRKNVTAMIQNIIAVWNRRETDQTIDSTSRALVDALARIEILKQFVNAEDGVFCFPDGSTIDGCGTALVRDMAPGHCSTCGSKPIAQYIRELFGEEDAKLFEKKDGL